jgi:hypothetical protein
MHCAAFQIFRRLNFSFLENMIHRYVNRSTVFVRVSSTDVYIDTDIVQFVTYYFKHNDNYSSYSREDETVLVRRG